jgi:hypothetical protein
MAKKKKPAAPPKIRRGWDINPKTRVAPSKKTYQRKKEKKNLRTNDLNGIGD